MYSVFKKEKDIQDNERRTAQERLQKELLQNSQRRKLTEKLSKQYKNKVANFISKMAGHEITPIHDAKATIETYMTNRYPPTFRPNFH